VGDGHRGDTGRSVPDQTEFVGGASAAPSATFCNAARCADLDA